MRRHPYYSLYSLLPFSLFLIVAYALPCRSHAQFRRIVTIAGNGMTGPAQDKGRALQSALASPFGIHPEADGSLIIASFAQHVLYRLDPTYSRLEIIAGTGTAGNGGASGDFPTRVEMNQPHEVQVDAQGNIYVADTKNHRVGMIEAVTGRWQTVAGTGQSGFSGDGSHASSAKLDLVFSIAIDNSDLFIADLGNQRVRKLNLQLGQIDTICGTGEKKLPTHGGRAAAQPLAGPRSLAAEPSNVWIVLREGNSVWRLDRRDQRIYHVAGSGEPGFSGDGGDARLAQLNGPKGIAVDPGEAIYIADTENHAIRRVDLSSGRISTLVGSSDGASGFNGDGDQLATRLLNHPHSVCLLDSGELVVGDSGNHRVRLLRL